MNGGWNKKKKKRILIGQSGGIFIFVADGNSVFGGDYLRQRDIHQSDGIENDERPTLH
jgi:hypothetical protein